jgi:hypothetical protein
MADWHELVIQGADETLRGFILGFATGRPEVAPVVLGADLALETVSIGERLKALFAAGSHHLVFTPVPFATSLADAIASRGAEVGLRLERRRHVTAVSFSFRADVFSADVAREVRTLLVDSLPAGTRVDEFSERTESHPEARGPEPFAPLHSFAYHASGRVIGAFDAVIDVWKRARERETIDTGSLTVEGNPLE